MFKKSVAKKLLDLKIEIYIYQKKSHKRPSIRKYTKHQGKANQNHSKIQSSKNAYFQKAK